ncbi:MAG: hypothetical protein LW875_10235, partial [Proteobacteria bacterium]|nr:hypothetical protein [Pseudomonadota bacterium]
MNWWKNWSLKFKLITMSVGTVIAIAGVSAFFSQRIADSGKEMYATAYESLAEEVSKAIQAQFFERYGDVQAFAGNASIVALDPKGAQSALDFYTALYGIYDLLVVVDHNGRFVASNTKEPSGKLVNQDALKNHDFTKDVWFQNVMKENYTSELADGFNGTYVEPYIQDSLQKVAFSEDRFGTGFSAPIKDASGKIVGVISNRTNPKWVESVFTGMYDSLRSKGVKSASFVLLDPKGYLLIEHNPAAQGFKNEIKRDTSAIFKFHLAETGSQIGRDLVEGKTNHGFFSDGQSGSTIVAGYTPVKGPKIVDSIGWGVAVKADSGEVFAAMNRDMQAIWLGFGVLALVAIFTSFWFATSASKSIMGRVAELLKASNEVTDASSKIAAQSTELSESATEQAAAIQETMSAVDEI